MGPALLVPLLASHQLDPRHVKTSRGASILSLKNFIQGSIPLAGYKFKEPTWVQLSTSYIHFSYLVPLVTSLTSLTDVGLSAHPLLTARLLFDTQEGFNCFFIHSLQCRVCPWWQYEFQDKIKSQGIKIPASMKAETKLYFLIFSPQKSVAFFHEKDILLCYSGKGNILYGHICKNPFILS